MYPCSKTGEQVGNVSSAQRLTPVLSHLRTQHTVLLSLLNKGL